MTTILYLKLLYLVQFAYDICSLKKKKKTFSNLLKLLIEHLINFTNFPLSTS